MKVIKKYKYILQKDLGNFDFVNFYPSSLVQ